MTQHGGRGGTDALWTETMGTGMGSVLPDPMLPDPMMPDPMLFNPMLPVPMFPDPTLPGPLLPDTIGTDQVGFGSGGTGPSYTQRPSLGLAWTDQDPFAIDHFAEQYTSTTPFDTVNPAQLIGIPTPSNVATGGGAVGSSDAGSQEGTSSGDGRSHAFKLSAKDTTAQAARVRESLARFDTAAYVPYNPSDGIRSSVVVRKWTGSYEPFATWRLVTGPAIRSFRDVPIGGVRVDDQVAAMLIREMRRKELQQWLADFDQGGMVRSTRIPLGRAARGYFSVGDRDVDGNVLGPGEEGYYYLWQHGIHLLCGDEGWRNDLYRKRPCREKEVPEKLVFRKGYKAVSQDP